MSHLLRKVCGTSFSFVILTLLTCIWVCSPSVSLDVEEEDYDDNLTPLVPLIPIEEEESMDNLPELAEVNPPTDVQLRNLQQYILATAPFTSDSSTSRTVSLPASAMPLAGIIPGIGAELAGAAAVIAAIMKSNEQGNLVDMNLLARILNDPSMIERLISEHRTAATTVSASMGIPSVSLSTPPLDAAASGITLTSTVGFGLRPATQPVSLLNKHATMLVPTMPLLSQLTSTHDKLATLSVPLSRPMPSNPATPSISLHTPPAPPHMHRTYIDMPNGMPPALNAQPPQHDILAYGANRGAAPFTSITLNELNSVPLPSANLHSVVVNQVQSAASAMPYQLSTTGPAPAVKDANYYKNLVRQHGADKHDTQYSQIGIRQSNFQDLKPVHNKPGEVKHKIQKPCIYFKSYRGCRNGNNCPFQHDMPVQRGGGQNAKKLKL